MTLSIIILVISLIMSAFFSGMEMAFISANRLQIELENNEGFWVGRRIAWFIKKPTRFINTILIGNNISLVVLSLAASSLLEPFLRSIIQGDHEPAIILIQTVITTIVLLFFGEFIPKALFRVYANPILKAFVFPFTVIYYVLWIVVKLFGFISRFILTLFGVKMPEQGSHFSPVDLQHFVKEHSISEEQDREIDTDLFENALYLRETKVRECMIPRTEIAAVEEHDSLEDLRAMIIDKHFSRILVYRETIDNIIGYVHHFDLLTNPKEIKEMMMPIKAVTETALAQGLLNDFIKEARNIAYVVDEYGGTSGMITMEDILEEIFGEIHDEYDNETVIAKQIGENEYMISGRYEVDRLNDEYNLEIPEGEYETISGFILIHHEKIPELNDVVEIDDFMFTITDVTEKKIEMVRLLVSKHDQSL